MKKRIISRLDIKGSNLVKGVNLEGLRVLGKPWKFAKAYYQSGIAGTNTYEIIIDFFSATSTIFNLLTFGAIYVLRKKWPDKDRPYRALFYPWSMIIVLLLYSAFLIITLITAFVPSLTGIALTASGTLYYLKKVKN